MSYTSPADINVSNGFVGVFSYLNNVTYNWFSNILLIVIYTIIAMTYFKAKDDLIGAFAVAGFGTFVFAFLMFIGGAVTGGTLAISIAVLIAGVAWILLDKQGTA